LRDLRLPDVTRIQGENRYLGPGASVFLPNTSEVIRSAYKGDLARWSETGLVTLETQAVLTPFGTEGDMVELAHGFKIAPAAYCLKLVEGNLWVDATGTVDVSHDIKFTVTYIRNTLDMTQTLYIRLV
jgi:hypothetical protein